MVGASCGAAPPEVLDAADGGLLPGTPSSGGTDAGNGAEADEGEADEAGAVADAGGASDAGPDGAAGAGDGARCTGARCAGTGGFAPESHAIHARSLSRNLSKAPGCTSVSNRTRASIRRARNAR